LSYSKITTAQLPVSRSTARCADLAVNQPAGFAVIANQAKAALDSRVSEDL
jgi:hypothetical protein